MDDETFYTEIKGHSMTYQGYFSIMRPTNAVVAGLAAVIGYFIATSTIIPAVLLLIVIVFLVTAGGNVINDYYDSEIDAINRPDRPIPSGKVKKERAYHFAAALFIAGVVLSLFTNPLCAGIAVFNSVILVLYASRLKKSFMSGNIAVSYLSASIFLFGGALSGPEGLLRLVPLALITFLAMMSRELLKDAEDVEGDRASGAVTYPIRYGIRTTMWVSLFFIIGAIVASVIPVYLWGEWYLFGIGVVDLLILYAVLRPLKCKTPECLRLTRATTLLKYGMFASLVVFTISAVFL
jgi:geranylgeranylglycerol-phosphate geranylgeranyltransferase